VPQVILDTPMDDRDAGLLVTAEGTLIVSTFTSIAYQKPLAAMPDGERKVRWLAAERGLTLEERERYLGAWTVRSVDGGMTWERPERIAITNPHGPIAMRNGELLFAGKRYPGADQSIGVMKSRDDGKSWTWLAEIPTRPGDREEDYHELHAVEAQSGKLVVHIRNHNPRNSQETLQSESVDGGRSWSVPRELGVWGLPSHLLRLRDGRLLMSYSYRREPRGNHARVSVDEGRTWSAPIVLSDDGVSDLGYPSTVELADGTLVTAWYEVRAVGQAAILRIGRWKPPSV
jgi:hypothetical protein